MYPRPPLTTVHVDELTAELCGAARPTHFDGVTTVVTKLFAIAGPCRAYFGRKDAQQLAVVRRMTEDLEPAGRRRRLPARARARWPRAVEPQRVPHAGGTRAPRPCCPARCAPRPTRSSRGERDPRRSSPRSSATTVASRAARRARVRRSAGRRRSRPTSNGSTVTCSRARRSPRLDAPHRQRRARRSTASTSQSTSGTATPGDGPRGVLAVGS